MELSEELASIERIKVLKARYFRLMDTKDWNGLREVFCQDGVFDARAAFDVDGVRSDPPDPSDPLVGITSEGIVTFISTAIGKRRTVHHGHCHEIEIISPIEAHGIVSMEDIVLEPDGKTRMIQGWGHYHEEYRVERGAWRILKSSLTRIHLERDR